jgi:hypothetical protein
MTKKFIVFIREACIGEIPVTRFYIEN